MLKLIFILYYFVCVLQCLYILNGFREHLSAHQLYSTLKSFLVRQRLIEFRDLYKEVNATPPPQPPPPPFARSPRSRPASAADRMYYHGPNDSVSANSWKLFDYSLPRNERPVPPLRHRGQSAAGFSRAHGIALPGHLPRSYYRPEPSRRQSVFDARAQSSPSLPYDEMSYYHAYNDPHGYYWYS